VVICDLLFGVEGLQLVPKPKRYVGFEERVVSGRETGCSPFQRSVLLNYPINLEIEKTKKR
jgi:hypothetical protein